MMVKPSVTELLTKADNRYELVIATARRARQIVKKRLDAKNSKKGIQVAESGMSGTSSHSVSKSAYDSKDKEESAVTIAATEIAEGKVKIETVNED